ncbi:hypothetical protein Sbs19_39400 [Sphingobium sp. BS19]|nr:hypothetical protein Sbs19_39400 [Sphingobium sp. BS19]
MVLAGKRCRAGGAAIGRNGVISGGGRPLAAVVLRISVSCARFNSGMGMRPVVGQDAMSVTVM